MKISKIDNRWQKSGSRNKVDDLKNLKERSQGEGYAVFLARLGENEVVFPLRPSLCQCGERFMRTVLGDATWVLLLAR